MAEICLDRSIRLSLRSIRPSIGTENPIPEEMDHREIAVRVPVMNEMQFLFPSEPCKSLKPRSLYVVFLVELSINNPCRLRGAWRASTSPSFVFCRPSTHLCFSCPHTTPPLPIP